MAQIMFMIVCRLLFNELVDEKYVYKYSNCWGKERYSDWFFFYIEKVDFMRRKMSR